MFGKNRNHRNERSSESRYTNREHRRTGRDRHDRDFQPHRVFDPGFDPSMEALSDRGGWRLEDRDEEGYRSRDFYDRDHQKDFRSDFRMGGRESFRGQPGLAGASHYAQHSSSTSQGYRPYQDYGAPLTTERGFFGKGPKGYRRSDEKIYDEVCELLTSHYEIDASEIEVEVKEGIVTLSGTVESRRMKRMTEDVVADMNGVLDVRNNLRISSQENRMLDASMDGKSTNYRSPAASTDSTLGGKSGRSASSSQTVRQ